jgi:hypothetical protein
MTRMTRILALLLALLLPLQLSWAVVGEYCQHESSPMAARHFGHHQHVHKDAAGKVAGKSAIDSDCRLLPRRCAGDDGSERATPA